MRPATITIHGLADIAAQLQPILRSHPPLPGTDHLNTTATAEAEAVLRRHGLDTTDTCDPADQID